MSDSPGSVGRYRIRRQIGRGMMGVVYEALDPDLDRIVAVKTIQLAFPVSKGEKEAFEERFFVEARIAARLSHPGIVVVHDVGRDPASGTLFIVLERLEGHTLAEVIARGEPVPWREALRTVAGVAEALDHAHRQGIVHRDMKPANVMVLPSGQPKIMDFGIAKIANAQGALTLAGQFFGTPLYMAPEQALGGEVDGRTDIFSLGSILYALLTGHQAFEAESVPRVLARIAHEDPPPPSHVVGEIPTDVDAVVIRAMAKDASARYPEAAFLASDIEDLLCGQPPRHLAGWVRPSPAERTEAATVEPLHATSGVDTADLWADVGKEPLPHWEPDGPRNDEAPTPPGPRASKLARTALGGCLVLVVAFALYRASRDVPNHPPAAAVASPDVAPSAPRPGGSGAEANPPPGPGSPASALVVDVEHSLRSGSLSLWLDGDLVLTEHLAARVQKKILFFTIRRGVVQKELEVAPGDHRVRVEIRWDENQESDEISASFRPGATRRLHVGVSRLLKGLTMEWR